MNYLLDTNAIIYLLKGEANPLPFSDNDNILISFITKIELLCHNASSDEAIMIKSLLECYDILFIDDKLINKTIDVRKNYGLSLADSIITATAILENAILVTSDKGIIKKASDMNVKIFDPLA